LLHDLPQLMSSTTSIASRRCIPAASYARASPSETPRPRHTPANAGCQLDTDPSPNETPFQRKSAKSSPKIRASPRPQQRQMIHRPLLHEACRAPQYIRRKPHVRIREQQPFSRRRLIRLLQSMRFPQPPARQLITSTTRARLSTRANSFRIFRVESCDRSSTAMISRFG